MIRMEDYRNEFDICCREKLTDITPSDILQVCSNVFEVTREFPEFEPGTVYVLYRWTDKEVEELEKIVYSTVARVYHQKDDEGTNCVNICFKNLDERLVRQAEDMLRDFVTKNNKCPDEVTIRKVARSFVTQCLYF